MRRISDLALEVPHNNREKLIIYSLVNWVMHESLLAEFDKRGITGYRTRPTSVRFRDGVINHNYREVVIVGWAGVAKPASGVRLLETCPGCFRKRYSGLENASELIDWGRWTGEDFFKVWPLMSFPLITARVAELFAELKLDSYRLDDLKYIEASAGHPLGAVGFETTQLSSSLPEDLAIKYGRPLGLE